METDKHKLKPSILICVYPWFIEDIWNRCTSTEIPKYVHKLGFCIDLWINEFPAKQGIYFGIDALVFFFTIATTWKSTFKSTAHY